MSEEGLKHKDTWSNTYRGIFYEVVRWSGSDGKDMWNYYLYVDEQQFPEKMRPHWFLEAKPKEDRWFTGDYWEYGASGFYDLDFHGGLTYYEILGLHREFRTVKAGCDYSHLFDQEAQYNEAEVAFHASATIDELYEAVPELMTWNKEDGTYS